MSWRAPEVELCCVLLCGQMLPTRVRKQGAVMGLGARWVVDNHNNEVLLRMLTFVTRTPPNQGSGRGAIPSGYPPATSSEQGPSVIHQPGEHAEPPS